MTRLLSNPFTEFSRIPAYNPKMAIQINVQIMRAFVQLRHLVVDRIELKRELDEFRKETNDRFLLIFTILDELIPDDQEGGRKIGSIEAK